MEAGADAVAMLENYYADVAFVGVSALSVHPWLMDYSREAAELRSRMLGSAATPVLLADHTKFNRTAPVRVPGIERAAYLITDRAPEGPMAEALARLPADLWVADGAGD